jgi:ribosomal protein S18 acetylase RimI-like enzyme
MTSKKTKNRGADKIKFRPIKQKDQDFLFGLYASTRQDEMKLVTWDEAEKKKFLKLQFGAQHKFYTEQFGKARFDLIELEGEPIGRLYVDRRKEEIRVIDIALLPEYRSRGLGSELMKNILNEALLKQLPVRIHVEQNNPARRLYDRLGFQQIEENGIYHLMEWLPNK